MDAWEKRRETYYDQEWENMETYIIPYNLVRSSDKAIYIQVQIKTKVKIKDANMRHYWIPKSVIIDDAGLTLEVKAWFIDNLEEEHNVQIIKE